MGIHLDYHLIRKFRDKVNEHPYFRDLYKNVDGKNKWNIICSAMDWISVTAGGIPSIDLRSDEFGSDHVQSLNLMQYISSIDILHEAIIQLYRVLGVTHPLVQDHSIFKQTQVTDDKFFKHLRAAFGTHPVNLTSFDGVDAKTGERFYASWPAKGLMQKDGDFMVLLYSNDPSKDQKLSPLSVRISELNQYAEIRYGLLESLIQKIDDIMNKHMEDMRGSDIRTATDHIDQAHILLEENRMRFGEGGGHSNKIKYIIRMLKTEISPEVNVDYVIVNEYQNYISSQLFGIMADLQTMEINLSWDTFGEGYEFGKIYSYISGANPMGWVFLSKLITNGPLPSYLHHIGDREDEIQLVFEAYLYKAYLLNNSAIVNYKQFLNTVLI